VTNEFSVVDPLSSDTLWFDYSLQLASGETLTGTPSTVVVEVQSSDPAGNLRFGAPSVTDTRVGIVYSGCLNNVNYYLRVAAATTAGRTLVCSGVLPVRIT